MRSGLSKGRVDQKVKIGIERTIKLMYHFLWLAFFLVMAQITAVLGKGGQNFLLLGLNVLAWIGALVLGSLMAWSVLSWAWAIMTS